MTDSTARTQIILAAIATSGERDDQWFSRVVANTRDIALLTNEKSELSRLVESLVGNDTKVFPGTIVKVRKEERSTRGVVYLRTGTDRTSTDPVTGKTLPAGIEFARTDRTDSEIGRTLDRAVQVPDRPPRASSSPWKWSPTRSPMWIRYGTRRTP